MIASFIKEWPETIIGSKVRKALRLQCFCCCFFSSVVCNIQLIWPHQLNVFANCHMSNIHTLLSYIVVSKLNIFRCRICSLLIMMFALMIPPVFLLIYYYLYNKETVFYDILLRFIRFLNTCTCFLKNIWFFLSGFIVVE